MAYHIIPEGVMATETKAAPRPAWWPVGRTEQVRFGTHLAGQVLQAYPLRDVPEPFVPVRTEVMALAKLGIHPAALIAAAEGYRHHVLREHTEPKYRLGAVRFFRDGIWHRHVEPRVHGLTRGQWRVAGMDLAEFDRLSHGWDHYGPWQGPPAEGEAPRVAEPMDLAAFDQTSPGWGHYGPRQAPAPTGDA
jgi:hypothetical protein